MNEWYNLIQNLAVERVDQIERHLSRHPLEHPRFTEAAQKIDAAMGETDSHPNPELTERDNLWMSYSAELAIEMYLAGARDGGRVYHAFVTGELPSIQKREENTMNRLTPERLKALREQYPKELSPHSIWRAGFFTIRLGRKKTRMGICLQMDDTEPRYSHLICAMLSWT